MICVIRYWGRKMKTYKATIVRSKIIYEEAEITIQVNDVDFDVDEAIKNAFSAEDDEDWQECDYEISRNYFEVKNIKQCGDK